MDIIFLLWLAWYMLRGAAEDTAAWMQGKASPRREYRLKHGPGAGEKIAHAVADRVADRIANGPKDKPEKSETESGRFRRWWGGLREDAGNAAHHNRDRARQRQDDVADDPQDDRDRARQGGSVPGGERLRWWEKFRPPQQPETPEPVEPTEPIKATSERLDEPTSDFTPPPDAAVPDSVQATAERLDGIVHDYDDSEFTTRYCEHLSAQELENMIRAAWSKGELAPKFGGRDWMTLPLHVRADLLRVAADNDLTFPRIERLDRDAVRLRDEWRKTEPRLGGWPAIEAAPRDLAADVIDAEIVDHPATPTDVRATGTEHPIEGGNTMTAPAEHGLVAYEQFGQNLKAGCEQAIQNIETTVASLQTDEFEGDSVEGFTAATEHFQAAIAEIDRSLAGLERSHGVRDSYMAEQGAGSKQALLAD